MASLSPCLLNILTKRYLFNSLKIANNEYSMTVGDQNETYILENNILRTD